MQLFGCGFEVIVYSRPINNVPKCTNVIGAAVLIMQAVAEVEEVWF
jgi:hypothetical protein